MLGIGGRFAGAKGMVQMPDLANLNPEQAAALLSVNGLRVGNQPSVTTSNSSLGNRVFNQTIAAGQLVDYETVVGYSYYIYVAPAVVISYGSPEQYDTNVEVGCNKTPNFQNASNQYFYCSRVTRFFRSRKFENGIWYGEYGQYYSETDSAWDCSIVAGQCGNNETAPTEISRSQCIGAAGTTGYQDVTYRRNYVSGSPTGLTYTVQEAGCVIPPAVTETGRSTSRGGCSSPGVGGCKCGQRSVTTTISYSNGTTSTISSTECCPDSTSCSNTPIYWFSCGAFSPNLRRWTFRTICTDCVGGVVSDTRQSGDVSCCTASCGSWSAWIKVATWVESRTRTCTRDDCSTFTETETRCIPHCDIWRDSTSCIGGRKTQTQKCQLSDCSFTTSTRTVTCTGGGGGGILVAV